MNSQALATRDQQWLIAQIMRRIREPHFRRAQDPSWNPRQPVIYYEETCFRGRAFMVPMVILRSRPCRWFSSGGCVMCNYELIEAIHENITADDLLAQVDYAIGRLAPLSQYNYLFITSGGSFLDPQEVPDDVRFEILSRLRNAGLERVSFESEAKFCLDSKRLEPISKVFPGAASVGIGFESANEFIRNVIVNKGMPASVFQRAIDVLQGVGIAFYNYVLLGKPFLTVEEDEADCIETIVKARQAGAFMTVVEMVNIQPFTLTSWLWERAQYRPPSLWSGLRVILETPTPYQSGVSVKGLERDDGIPGPADAPKGCSICSVRLRTALREWNLHRNIDALRSGWGTCSCFSEYEAQRRIGNPLRIEDRMSSELSRIADEFGISAKFSLIQLSNSPQEART